jgi:hypothetical protein
MSSSGVEKGQGAANDRYNDMISSKQYQIQDTTNENILFSAWLHDAGNVCMWLYVCLCTLRTYLLVSAGESLQLFVFHDQLATRAKLKSILKSLSATRTTH